MKNKKNILEMNCPLCGADIKIKNPKMNKEVCCSDKECIASKKQYALSLSVDYEGIAFLSEW